VSDEGDVATSALPGDLRVNFSCHDAGSGGCAGTELELLRENENRRTRERLRPSWAEVGSGQTMLCGLLGLPRSFAYFRVIVCESAIR